MRRLAAIALCACACGPKTASTPAWPRADAQLVVKVPVADARVYLDDVFIGRAAQLRRPAGVVSGHRRVEVRADGWFTAYREVEIPRGGTATVEVELRRVPEGEPGG